MENTIIMENTVFISYANQDCEIGQEFVEELAKHNIKCLDWSIQYVAEDTNHQNNVYLLLLTDRLGDELNNNPQLLEEIKTAGKSHCRLFYYKPENISIPPYEELNDFLQNATELVCFFDVISNIRSTLAGKSTKVFISYRSTHLDLAYALMQELEEHNISCWFDKRELHQDISTYYKDKIHRAIDNTTIVLYLYSHDVSEFIVEHEVEYARMKGKDIFCFPVDNPFEKVPKELENEHRTKVVSILKDIQLMYNRNDASLIPQINEAIHDEGYREILKKSIEDNPKHYASIDIFLMRIAIQKRFSQTTPYGTYTRLESSPLGETYAASQLRIKVLNKMFYYPIPEKYWDKLTELKFIRKDKPSKVKTLIKTLKEGYNPDTTSLLQELKDYIITNYQDKLEECKPEKIDRFLEDIAETTAESFIEQLEIKKKDMFNGAMLGMYSAKRNTIEDTEENELYLEMYHSDYFTFKFTVELYHKLRSVKNTFFITHLADIRPYAPFLCSLGMGGFIVAQQEEQLYLLWTKRSAIISSGNMWHFSFDETVSAEKDSLLENPNDPDSNIKIQQDGSIEILPYLNFYRGIREENGFFKEMLSEKKGIFEIGIITSERLEIEFLSYALINLKPFPSIREQLNDVLNNADDRKLEIDKIEIIKLEDSNNNFIGRLVTPESDSLCRSLLYRKKELLTDNKLFLRNDLEFGKNVVLGGNIHIGNNVKFRHNITIEDGVWIDDNTIIEDNCYLSKGCKIGKNCKIHRNVFVDEGVRIADRVKIQNNNSIYHGVELEEGVFVGTNVSFTNDKYPRSINRDNGKLKTGTDWKLEKTIVEKGASICSGATIVCGIRIGQWAMVGAGAVVTHDVEQETLVVGCPAKKLRDIN